MKSRIRQALITVTAATGFLMSAPSQATDLNYNFIEGGYVFNADAGVDGDGFRLRGSVEIAPQIVLMGEMFNLSFDNGGSAKGQMLGAGYLIRYDQQFDLLGSFEVGNLEARGPNPNAARVDETGFRIGLGVRGVLAPKVEGFGRFVYENFDTSDTYLEFGGFYHVNQQFRVGGSLQFGGDLDMMTISARYSF